MALKAKANNRTGAGEACPAGIHPGVCVGVIDLGTHWEQFQAQAPYKARKVWIVWEVEAEKEGKEQRYHLGQEYGIRYDDKGGLSLHSKNKLRQMLEGWRNRPYAETEDIDVDAILGKACQVNVVQETRTGTGGERTYAVVKAIMPLAKGMKPLAPSVKPLNQAIDSEEPYPGPEWMPRPWGIKVEDYLENSLERNGTGRKEDLRKKTDKTPVAAGVQTYYQPYEETETEAELTEADIPF